MKMFVTMIGAISSLFISSYAVANRANAIDCKLRFSLVEKHRKDVRYTTFADVNNSTLYMKLNSEYRLEANYRLNESKPWSPKPKVTGGRTSVILNASLLQMGPILNAIIIPSLDEGPQVLYIVPLVPTNNGQLALSVSIGGIESEGTIDEHNGNASCEGTNVTFKTY